MALGSRRNAQRKIRLYAGRVGCITVAFGGPRVRLPPRPRSRQPLAEGGVVPLLATIVELLKRERIPYTCFRHAPAYTAQEEAAVSHILEESWAKVVICIADGQPVQAVLPAHQRVDLERLRRL